MGDGYGGRTTSAAPVAKGIKMTEFTDAEITKFWEDLFARDDYRTQLSELAAAFPDKRSMIVDFNDIDNIDTDFSGLVITSPDRCLKLGTKVIVDFSERFSSTTYRVNLRINHLPHDVKVDIRNIRARHLNTMVAVDGLARKVTVVNPKAINARFTCAKCGQEIWVPQRGTLLSRPIACPNPATTCNKSANNFILDEVNTVYLDSQFVEIQESPDGLRGGQQPERKTCYLDDDLCGVITTGNRITVNAIVRSKEKKENDRTTLFETCLEVVSVEFEQHEYEEIQITPEDEAYLKEMSKDPMLFEHLSQSISPTIHGLREIKEAITLQMFGGCHKDNGNGSEIRGDIHILLMGDPGVAKSQLLRYTSNLAPRSIFASGKSASGAGLTAAVVRSDEFGDGRWNLEAGALVLADKGLACIDEFDKMTQEDRSALHEAMESQRISFAKAGITAVLQCRCSILAAANPKEGRFVRTSKFVSQIDLPPALISRFDLIFVLTDESNKENDRRLAEFIVGVHQRGEILNNGAEDAKIEGVDVAEVLSKTEKYVPYYDREVIRKYISYAKRFSPYMTDEVRKAIVDKYVEIRGQGGDGKITITARQLEALVRLSEASARMRLSPKVEKEDSDRAIRLFEYYLRCMADENGNLDYDSFGNTMDSNDRNVNQVVERIIQAKGKEGISFLDIVEEAGSMGWEREAVESSISFLNTKGTIYISTGGKYKMVS